MRGAILLFFAALSLTGCHKGMPPPADTSKPGTVTTAEPATGACDDTLGPQLGVRDFTFTACDVSSLVKLLGHEVRQAKSDCLAFIAFDPVWTRRTRNWEQVLAALKEKTANPTASTAESARKLVERFPTGETFRRTNLDRVVTTVVALEKHQNVTGPPVPDCKPPS